MGKDCRFFDFWYGKMYVKRNGGAENGAVEFRTCVGGCSCRGRCDGDDTPTKPVRASVEREQANYIWVVRLLLCIQKLLSGKLLA